MVTVILEYIGVVHIEQHSQEILAEESARIQTDIRTTFQSYQQETLQQLHELASGEKLQHVLLYQKENNVSDIVDLLRTRGSEDLSLEVYDQKKTLVGWFGNHGSVPADSLFSERERSCILQGTIYSYFVIVIPLVDNHRTVGYLAGKRLFKVGYADQ